MNNCTNERFKMNNVDFKKYLDEFIILYKNKPIRDNTGGMKFPHMFATYCFLKELDPLLIIESGIWYGQGTWLMENACPNAKIISIDISLYHRKYISNKVIYSSLDITYHDLNAYVRDYANGNFDKTVIFLDDHQNVLDRLKYINEYTDIKNILYEDNYPSNQGDCLSIKKILENTKYVISGQWYDSDPEDNKYLLSIINEYFEFPPVIKTETTRWGDLWDGVYETKSPLYETIPTEITIFENEMKDYTWICYLKMK